MRCILPDLWAGCSTVITVIVSAVPGAMNLIVGIFQAGSRRWIVGLT
jgi:hypothetical protein